jgi:hypothetical protein
MKSSSIIPPQTGGTVNSFDLCSGATYEAMRGGCYLSVSKGSVTFKQHKSEPLDICGQVTSFDLEHIFSSASAYFIQGLFFDLIAGEGGCSVMLYYPAIEKKDWGIPGIEKKF